MALYTMDTITDPTAKAKARLDRITAILAQTRRLRVLLAQEHGTFFGRHAKGVCPICDFLSETT